ncbi:MAG: ester cyclase [Ktedonobacteraceae bacterium]|nr:ester cyclase [Ktedonobacteraceae bacterium]
MLRLLFEEALHRGNLALIETLFSPDFIDHSTPHQPPGYAGVQDYFREIRTGFPDIQVILEDVITEGDTVVARTLWRGTHLGTYQGSPATGKTASRSLIQIFRLVDGLIREEWNEGRGLLEAF